MLIDDVRVPRDVAESSIVEVLIVVLDDATILVVDLGRGNGIIWRKRSSGFDLGSTSTM